MVIEAIVENGELKWRQPPPDLPDGTVVQVMVSSSKPRRDSEEMLRVLEEVKGSWGNMSMDEIDEGIRKMRDEWEARLPTR